MLPGINSRIEIELKDLQKENLNKGEKRFPIFILDKHYRNSSYVGAVIASSHYNESDNLDYWISKKDWDECGPKIVYKKAQCFLGMHWY